MAELDVAHEGHCVALTHHGEEDLCLAQMPIIPIIDVYAQIVDVAEKMLDRIPSERKPWKKLQSSEVVFVKEAKELYDRAGRDFVAEFKRRQRTRANCSKHVEETRNEVGSELKKLAARIGQLEASARTLASEKPILKSQIQKLDPLKLLMTGVSDGCRDYKTDYARRSLSSGGMREVFGQEPQGIMADGVESAARGGALGQEHVEKRMAEFGSAKASLEKQHDQGLKWQKHLSETSKRRELEDREISCKDWSCRGQYSDSSIGEARVKSRTELQVY
ncbi:hypothetical protein SELMODRAFT_420642 [Selaginella moellendorffii]|uniref:Uncharacterized protein n=1 Tax=Selaginella moellendorffii TaxID=88036 RepID=D8SCN2_SELML|nr:hypothetical protein SELMODRAFT_420642 [Selaginella moellendorffii]